MIIADYSCRRPSSGFQRPARGVLAQTSGVNDKCTLPVRPRPASDGRQDSHRSSLVRSSRALGGDNDPSRSSRSWIPLHSTTMDRGPSKRCSLDLRQRGQNGIQGDLSVAGSTFGPNADSVGRPARERTPTAHHNLDVPIPLDGVERVEVLRGSGQHLWRRRHERRPLTSSQPSPKTSEVRFGSQVGNFWRKCPDLDASLFARRYKRKLTLWLSSPVAFDQTATTAIPPRFSRTGFSTTLAIRRY